MMFEFIGYFSGFVFSFAGLAFAISLGIEFEKDESSKSTRTLFFFTLALFLTGWAMTVVVGVASHA